MCVKGNREYGFGFRSAPGRRKKGDFFAKGGQGDAAIRKRWCEAVAGEGKGRERGKSYSSKSEGRGREGNFRHGDFIGRNLCQRKPLERKEKKKRAFFSYLAVRKEGKGKASEGPVR